MNTTKHKQGKDKLRESEKKYRQLAETLQEGICILDKEGCTTFINTSMAEMLAYTVEEMQGKHLFSFMDEHSVDLAEQKLERCKQGTKEQHEFEFIKKDGTRISTRIGTSPLTDEDGNYIGALVDVRDITERKKAEKEEEMRRGMVFQEITDRIKTEQQLKNSDELYKNLIELAPDSIVTMDLKGYITSCNSAATRIFRYSKDDLVGKHFSKIGFLHVKDIPKYLKVFVSLLREKGTGVYELTVNDKDGASRIVETHIGLIKENNKISGILAITRDISERKKIEKEIIESGEKLKQILDSSPDAITVTDLNGNIIECNQTASKMYGSTKAELIGKNALEFFSPTDRNKAKDNLIKTLEVGSTKNVEYTLLTKDGREYPAELSASLIKDAPGNPQSFVAVVRDITERKKAEDDIKKERDFSKSLVDTAQTIVMVLDTEGNIVSFNPYLEELSGYKIDEVKGKDWFTTFLPECDYGPIRHLFKKSLRGIQTRGNINPIIAKDGCEILIEWYDKTIKDKDGKIIGLLAIGQDVTERKKTEEMLKESEERYKRLFNSSPELILETDEEGNIFAMNPMMAKSIGVSSDKSIGKNVFDILPSEIAEQRARIAKKALKEGKNQEVEDTRSGRRFHTIYVPIIYPNGKKTVQAIAKDITDQKKTETTLKESEEKYRILFNDVPVGISITDKSGHIMDCNQYMAEIFRYTLEELKAINIKSLYMNLKDRERLLNLLNKEGRVVDWECSFKRKDGAVFFAILNVNVIDREGQKLNLTSLRDITERKVAEEKIKKQNEQLKKLDDVKTDFLNTTSHELRTPIASIKGYIQMLLKHTLGDITEEQKKALEVLLRNTNRLDHLIQDILDISRLESGAMKFITEKTDVTKMVNEIAETMQASADLKRIKINIDIQKGIPDLMIDQERITQVLMNLVDNAIKFSPDDSRINIYTKMKKDNVLFEVQDFGRGIPKNKQKKIFERFYQVDSGIDRKFGGIGLGLTISKKIIDIYDGQIWVDSTLGKGSSFKFSLPLQSTKNIEDNLQEIMEWS